MKRNVFTLLILTFIFLAGCSSSIENKIVGSWKTEESNCGVYIDEEKEITFDDDMIIGMDGFKEYKVKEDKDPSILTLSGGYEDIHNFEIKMEEDNILYIVPQDEADEGFDSVLACKYEKVSD